MKKVLIQKRAVGVQRVLLEKNPEPLLLIDPDGRVVDMNGAWDEMSGMEYDTLAGTLFSDCFTDPEKAQEVYKNMFINGSVKDTGLVLYTKKGKLIDVIVSGAIYENEEGNVSGALVMVRDKGMQKKFDGQTAHLAAIVTSSDDAIISKSLEGTILTWNKGAEKTFGYLAEEAIGKHISILIPPYLVDEEERILEKVKSGEHLQQHEILRKRKDGVNIHVSITVSPIKDNSGNIIGVSTVERDITAQKRFENELIEARRNAEQATELAEEAVRSKQQFLSNMSHEIRTPLNAIIGFTKVVLKTELSEKQKEYLDAIKISGDAL
ncbi:MAG: PAS domain S-box protein, partial [Bacteroidia bacterium]